MEVTKLIPPKHPVLFPVITVHAPEYTFVSRPWLRPSPLHPTFYALVQHKNGQLDRVDYVSLAEYQFHRDRIKATIAKLHQVSGKRLGCNCDHCGK